MIGAWSGGAPASVLENLCVTQQYVSARYAEKDFRCHFGNLRSSGQFLAVRFAPTLMSMSPGEEQIGQRR